MDPADPAKWNRLVFVIVHVDDAGDYADTLLESGFSHTRINGSGGFGDLERMTASICRSRNEFVTLPWTGEIDVVSPIEVTVGGATMLVLEMEKAIRI